MSCEALIASASWHARDRSTWPSLFRSPVDPEIAVPHGGLLASVPVLCVCVVVASGEGCREAAEREVGTVTKLGSALS